MDEEVGAELRATDATPAQERLRAVTTERMPVEPRLATLAEPVAMTPGQMATATEPMIVEPRSAEPTTAARVAAEPLAAERVGTVAARQGVSAVEPTAATRIQGVTAGETTHERPATPDTTGSGGGGSAGTGFKVSPEQYQAAIAPIHAASDRIAALHASLSGFLAGMQASAPWGDDDSGKKFAEGDKGYLKYSEDTLKGLKGLPGGLQYIADGLKAMVDGYEGAETAFTSSLSDQEEELLATQGTYRSPNLEAESGVTAPVLPSATLRGIALTPRTPGRH
ncbi:hypothetical protein [Kitasatospora sp. NBC_00315]|uniref:hypothetical protein n=1 Tax=Kitasatospora sp. NBC_00315 TaxID=2975963 RepID=UPI00325506DA